MSPSFWSDEERVFVPRLGGWSINFKYLAKKLGWIKSDVVVSVDPLADSHETTPQSKEDRLRRSVERSRFEDN